MNSTDAFRLAAMGVIELRLVNMTKFFGGGVLHTKFIVADKTSKCNLCVCVCVCVTQCAKLVCCYLFIEFSC